jgi:hypothetical protein
MEYWSDGRGKRTKGFGGWEWLRVEDGLMNKN